MDYGENKINKFKGKIVNIMHVISWKIHLTYLEKIIFNEQTVIRLH